MEPRNVAAMIHRQATFRIQSVRTKRNHPLTCHSERTQWAEESSRVADFILLWFLFWRGGFLHSTPLCSEWHVGRWFCLSWKFSPCTPPEIFIIRYYFLHRLYIHAMLSPVQSIKLKFDWNHTSKCLKTSWENLQKQCNFCAHCQNFRQNLVLKENFRVDRLTFLWFIDKI